MQTDSDFHPQPKKFSNYTVIKAIVTNLILVNNLTIIRLLAFRSLTFGCFSRVPIAVLTSYCFWHWQGLVIPTIVFNNTLVLELFHCICQALGYIGHPKPFLIFYSLNITCFTIP